VARACRHFGISRQAFYQAGCRHQRRRASETKALALVSDCRVRQPRIGTRKLHHLIGPKLQAAGITMGRDRLFDVLREARLLVRNVGLITRLPTAIIAFAGIRICSNLAKDA